MKKDESGGFPHTEDPPPNNNATRPGACGTFRAVEEHAAALNISAPVFAAVKQANGWAAGKKVEKAEFEKAVNGFLQAPTGGR
jgi:hypothetical protein